jgi:hypothetical protein
MWILFFLLNLLGPKNFLRFTVAWILGMAFILYCFVHETFDTPGATQRILVPHRSVTPSR